MNNNNKIDKEILEEEYMLGKEYYHKILDAVKEKQTKKYE